MGQKQFMEDQLGAITSALSGYSPGQIRDMKSNKIALNAYGEPVYADTGKFAKPVSKIDPFLGTLPIDMLFDYGSNAIIQPPLGKKEQCPIK